jgi:hypothetical protein
MQGIWRNERSYFCMDSIVQTPQNTNHVQTIGDQRTVDLVQAAKYVHPDFRLGALRTPREALHRCYGITDNACIEQ